MFWWKRFVAHRLQTEGIEGDDIREFQQILNQRAQRLGISVEETGVYDAQTLKAVSDFQYYRLNVQADGFVGPQTARALHIRLEE